MQHTTSTAQPDTPHTPRRKGISPEAVLGLIALLAAAAFVCMVILCLPYLPTRTADDPEELVRHRQINTLPTRAPSDPEPTQPATEPLEEGPLPEANPYGNLDFQYNQNNYLYCLQQDSFPGVDVSAFQGDIDWQQVKDSGIRFAILRIGYRGYESGKLVEDEYIRQNLEKTAEVGLPIGVYFFSQALTVKEVDQEIEFMLEILGDRELEMPIVLDWEIPTADARTAKMDADTLTELQTHFCTTMEEKGYTPMIYFNWHQSNTLLHLTDLERWPFWLALYSDRMTYPHHVELWQYTDQGKVPGISGNVDLNLYIPKV